MTRAEEAIQAEAHSLATVRVLGAIESRDWAALARLAEQLEELAWRGLHHQSLEMARRVGASALGSHREPEPR